MGTLPAGWHVDVHHRPSKLSTVSTMYLIAIAWIYVVLMMAVAEALSTQGTVLGALITFVMYGLLPLALVLYIFGTPARKRARKLAELQAPQVGVPRSAPLAEPPSAAPDSSSHAPGDAVAAERKEA
jgi:hypothetical protein